MTNLYLFPTFANLAVSVLLPQLNDISQPFPTLVVIPRFGALLNQSPIQRLWPVSVQPYLALAATQPVILDIVSEEVELLLLLVWPNLVTLLKFWVIGALTYRRYIDCPLSQRTEIAKVLAAASG